MIRQAAGSLMLGVLALPLAGQKALSSPSEWRFANAQGSFCVSYLMEPATAAKLAPKETVLAPAGQGEGLHPQVSRVVQDEPEFGRWIPASVCVGQFESVTTGGQVVATMKPGKPILFVTHTLAASSVRGAAAGSVLLGMYTDNGNLQRALDRAGQTVRRVSREVPIVPEGRDPRITVKLDGFQLLWEGAPRGEERVVQTRGMSFGYTAQRGLLWTGVLEVGGGVGRTQFGGLGVEGKNSWGKALRASPIRAMGPLETGSTLTMKLNPANQK